MGFEFPVRPMRSDEKVKSGTRYVPPAEVVANVRAAAISTFDAQNLVEKLPLFSVAELLYRYLRCDAVHNAEFPFVNELEDMNDNIENRI